MFVLPLVTYVVIARFVTWDAPRLPHRTSDYGLALAAVAISALTVVWYLIHWSLIFAHIVQATNSNVALLYGSIRPFFSKFAFWLRQLAWAVSPFIWAGVLGLFLCTLGPGLMLAQQLRRFPSNISLRVIVRSGLLFLMCLLATVLAVVVAYSKSIEEDPRFVAAMVPLLAMLVSGSLTIVGCPLLSGFVVAFFTANWMVVQLAAQGVLSFPWGSSAWLRTPEIDLQSVQRLTHVVHATCDKQRAGNLSVIGADLPDFNAASAWFYAEKMQGEVGYRCNYNNLGYAAKDVNRAIRQLIDSNADYLVTLPVDKLPAPEADPFNRVSQPVAKWIASSPDFERVTSPDTELVIYKRRR
jgi:hypothetical protein